MENTPQISNGVNKTLWVVIAAAVIIVGGYALVRSGQDPAEKDAMTQKEEMIPVESKDNSMGQTTEEDAMEKKNAAMAPNQSASAKGSGQVDSNKMMQAKGAYVEYSPAALATATKNGKAVLFFHAAWCPFCKAANEAFNSRLSKIPEGVTVLKTDYDTQKELKTKYGVTYQHTFVQVDASGNMVAKWNGGDIDALLANIK